MYEYQTLLAGLLAIVAGLFIYFVPGIEIGLQRGAHRQSVRRVLITEVEKALALGENLRNLAEQQSEDLLDGFKGLVSLRLMQMFSLAELSTLAKPEYFAEDEWSDLCMIDMHMRMIKKSYEHISAANNLERVKSGIDLFIYQPSLSVKKIAANLLKEDIFTS